MSLLVGKKYLLTIIVGEKILNYTALVTSIDSRFVSFKDKFGKEYSYNLDNILSYTEVLNGE